MADTYSNTTDKYHGDKKPEGRHFNKYDNDFKKDTNALNNTPYSKWADSCAKKGEAIDRRQKKHY